MTTTESQVVEYRIQYNDSPGESWSGWDLYDTYTTRREAAKVLSTLMERRKNFETVFRFCKVTTFVTEEVLLDTDSLGDIVIQEEPHPTDQEG